MGDSGSRLECRSPTPLSERRGRGPAEGPTTQRPNKLLGRPRSSFPSRVMGQGAASVSAWQRVAQPNASLGQSAGLPPAQPADTPGTAGTQPAG